MRYRYKGDWLTDIVLKDQPCDPVRRADGKCVVGCSKQLVVFSDGRQVIVLRRRLVVIDHPRAPELLPERNS